MQTNDLGPRAFLIILDVLHAFDEQTGRRRLTASAREQHRRIDRLGSRRPIANQRNPKRPADVLADTIERDLSSACVARHLKVDANLGQHRCRHLRKGLIFVLTRVVFAPFR